jgi:PAS domain-containing protein
MSADKPAHWYRRALDSMTDFVLVKDTRSRLIWANQAFCDYYHMSLDELTAGLELPEDMQSAIVIMLTSSSCYPDRERALSHSTVEDYVVKPLTRSHATMLADRLGRLP